MLWLSMWVLALVDNHGDPVNIAKSEDGVVGNIISDHSLGISMSSHLITPYDNHIIKEHQEFLVTFRKKVFFCPYWSYPSLKHPTIPQRKLSFSKLWFLRILLLLGKQPSQNVWQLWSLHSRSRVKVWAFAHTHKHRIYNFKYSKL